MRTRTRNNILRSVTVPPAFNNTTLNWCNGNSTTATTTLPGITVALETQLETIIDSLGKGKVNPCTHDKVHITMGEYSGPLTHSTTQAPHGNGVWSYDNGHGFHHVVNNGYKHHYAGIDPATGLLSRWTLSGSVDENALKEQVMESAKSLKADVLLNLVEANQMWPAVQSLANSLPNMARGWNQIRKNLSKVSGAYLAWKFGISPIISDFSNIVRYAPKLGTDLKRYADGEKSRFVAFAPLVLSFNSTPINHHSIGSTVIERTVGQGRVLKTPGVRYVLVVKPTTRYHTAFFQNLSGFLGRFASSPASLAWEKVPFSFVVDWFVDLRGALRKLDDIVGFQPYEIVGFSRSLSYSMATDVQLERFNICSGGTLASYRMCSAEQVHYERIPVSGGTIMPRWTPRFGKNQAGISAALIAQQLSKLRA